jgi:hypothetical protein
MSNETVASVTKMWEVIGQIHEMDICLVTGGTHRKFSEILYRIVCMLLK